MNKRKIPTHMNPIIKAIGSSIKYPIANRIIPTISIAMNIAIISSMLISNLPRPSSNHKHKLTQKLSTLQILLILFSILVLVILGLIWEIKQLILLIK